MPTSAWGQFACYKNKVSQKREQGCKMENTIAGILSLREKKLEN